MGPVSMAVLFAGALGRSERVAAWTKAGMVARPDSVFAGADHSAVSRALSIHLLLLSRRLLQGLLAGSRELRRRRTAEDVSRRKLLSADPPERPPLFPVRGSHLPVHSELGRLEGDVVSNRDRRQGIRRWTWHDHPGCQRGLPYLLHAGWPGDAAHRRRFSRGAVEEARAQSGV